MSILTEKYQVTFWIFLIITGLAGTGLVGLLIGMFELINDIRNCNV